MADLPIAQNQSGSNNLMAGRDLHIHIEEDDITEPELHNVVKAFLKSSANIAPDDFILINLKEKNQLNGVSDAMFHQMNVETIVGYETIDSLLKSAPNDSLRDDYGCLVYLLQTKYLASNLNGKIERFFAKLFNEYGKDTNNMRESIWGMRLVFYMYLRCDLGIK